MMLSVRWRVLVSVQISIGPWPMHEVVLMAVRKAVSAATITFTANSMMRCFFIRLYPFPPPELPPLSLSGCRLVS